ncbi:MAG: hypothetical protein RLY90_1217 [Pseudomonadota bacterium]|jgi:hypothetical protein
MNQLIFKLFKFRSFSLISIALIAMSAAGQTFKMPCDVSGSLQVGSKSTSFRHQTVEVEILTMGRNIFMKINGDSDYQMQASSLVTEDYSGVNLTSANQIGAKRTHRKSGSEYDIRVERESVRLRARAEILGNDKKTRIELEGPCTIPK